MSAQRKGHQADHSVCELPQHVHCGDVHVVWRELLKSLSQSHEHTTQTTFKTEEVGDDVTIYGELQT